MPDVHMVYLLAVSPHGDLLAAGGGSSEEKGYWSEGGHRLIRLWGLPNGEAARVLTHESGSVNAIAFSSDGKTLAVGDDKYTYLWQVPQGELLAKMVQSNTPLGYGVRDLAFSPDGSLLATASNVTNGPVRVWEVPSGKPAGDLGGGHESYPNLVRFSCDGRFLAFKNGEHVLLCEALASRAEPT